MSAVEAIKILDQLSAKMSGLTINECRAYDNALDVLKRFIQQPRPVPVEPKPIGVVTTDAPNP